MGTRSNHGLRRGLTGAVVGSFLSSLLIAASWPSPSGLPQEPHPNPVRFEKKSAGEAVRLANSSTPTVTQSGNVPTTVPAGQVSPGGSFGPQQGPPTHGGIQPPVRTPIPAHTKSAYSSRQNFGGVPQLNVGGQPVGGTGQGPGSAASMNVVWNGTVLPPRRAGSNRLLLPIGVSNLSLFVPQTQTNELFVLGVPPNPAPNAPLLVGFHRFAVSHADVLYNTDFFEEAFARGWYIMTPLSANSTVDPTRSFSVLEGQINSYAALEWVCANYPIDMSRIYAVGFSAGGGMALSMASRYQDPTAPMFAAVVGHTGTIDIADSYALGTNQEQNFFNTLYGGDPVSQAFEYRRTSSIHLDGNHQWLAGGHHMATNLGQLNALIWYDTLDPLTSLVQQNNQLMDWSLVSGTPGFTLQTVSMGAHSWDTLDEVQVCDWLANHQLQMPMSGDLLMDRNARFQHFDLVQDAANQFSRLSFDIQSGAQTISLLDTSNVFSLSFSTSELGWTLLPGSILVADLSAADGMGDTIVMRDVMAGPASVRRDGVMSSNWTYSVIGNTLQLTESDPGLHTWTIQF